MGSRGRLTIVVMLVGIIWSGVYLGRLVRAEANAPPTAAAQKKLSRRQQQLAGAKVLYLENCARCHGADGQGKTPMGEVYGATNLADPQWWKKERGGEKRLTASLRDGRGGMPAFGKKLSREEIVALVAFVKTFNGK